MQLTRVSFPRRRESSERHSADGGVTTHALDSRRRGNDEGWNARFDSQFASGELQETL